MNATDLDRGGSEQDPLAPGWRWDPESETYVWWDGTTYTSRARWDGAEWHTLPLWTGATPSAVPHPAARSRHRWWWWLLLVPIGLVVLGGLAYGFHEVCCTHDLLEAGFDSDGGPFETGERTEYAAEIHEGTYRLRSKTATPSSPALSSAWLARPAGAVLVEVTVVDPGDGDVGIACIDESASLIDVGHVFTVGAAGSSLVNLGDQATVRRVPSGPPLPGQRIGIRCGFGDVVGLIDGEVVVAATYDRGPHSLDRVALYFDPAHAGDAVRFDDVDARLP